MERYEIIGRCTSCGMRYKKCAARIKACCKKCNHDGPDGTCMNGMREKHE